MQSDAFSVLGVPVTASHRELIDRYHFVRHSLDRILSRSKDGALEFATQCSSEVDQAFQTLSDEDSRIQLTRQLQDQVIERKPQPESYLAKALLDYPTSAITAFYEGAVDDLKILQYRSPNNIAIITETLHDLNLAYLYVWTDQSGGGGGQSVKVPRSPHPSPSDREAEALPDLGLSTIP